MPGAVDQSDVLFAPGRRRAKVWRHLGKLGRTTVYGNYEHYNTGGIIGGNSFTATGRPRDLRNLFNTGAVTFLGSGADIDVWGAGVNQNIEAASLDVYLAWQRAEADITGSRNGSANGPGAQTISIEPIDMIMSGAVIKF